MADVLEAIVFQCANCGSSLLERPVAFDIAGLVVLLGSCCTNPAEQGAGTRMVGS